MSDCKDGLIVKIKIHNILNEWNILSKASQSMSYHLALRAYRKLVKYGKENCTCCVATALDLPYRHLKSTPKGLIHALHATVLILNDTALKGLIVYE